MLDVKWICKNQNFFDELLISRGVFPIAQKIIELESEKNQLITLVQNLRSSHKKKNKLLEGVKDEDFEKFEKIKIDNKDLSNKITELESKLKHKTIQLEEILYTIPNVLSSDVPNGVNSDSNLLIRKYKEINNINNPKSHFDLGVDLNLMDFKQTAKMSGGRFVTLMGELARLERALFNFMMDIHTKEYNFTEISPPYLVNYDAMYRVGQLPKFDQDSFSTTNGYKLIPTAEVPLVNLVYNKIFPQKMLPLRLVAYTPCFRSEAGSYGKDNRGVIRLHQFNKVELVSITAQEESQKEHEYLLSIAETILKRLDLPYRVMLLCSGDTGFCSFKTYDIEVWLPSQETYREIASCSNCIDFQARRLKTRYKSYEKNILVHTLNSSGLPIGRTIAAIMENYQNPDGSISIPDALIDYMGGIKLIKKDYGNFLR